MSRSRFTGIDPGSRWGLLGFEGLIFLSVMAVGFISLACGSDEEEEDDGTETICCLSEDGTLESIIVNEDDFDGDNAAELCEGEGLGSVVADLCDESVCCEQDGAFFDDELEDCVEEGGQVVDDTQCGGDPEPEPDDNPDPQPTTPGGECACGEGTLTFEGDECFEDAGECSGFHSVFCFRDPPPENDPTCDFDDPEQDQADFEGVSFPSGTEFCAFDCCITLTCN